MVPFTSSGHTKDILRLKTEMRDVLQEATDSGKMQTMLDEFPGYSAWCGGFGLAARWCPRPSRTMPGRQNVMLLDSRLLS